MNFMSHIGQDRWVCEVFKYKNSGFFLDFGAFEGLLHDNTFYLEKFLKWKGILVEPNPIPYESACSVRSCITINAALYDKSRQSLQFTDSHGLSSLIDYADSDCNKELRKKISKGLFNVDTINPTELLNRFNAPYNIDYMSLDVEGAELVVLKSLDLDKYKIGLLTIEHNHDSKKQDEVRSHLFKYGYRVIAHYNDDFFYNLEVIKKLTDDNYTDPIVAHKNVLENYKFLDY
jgi:hypothetical protein